MAYELAINRVMALCAFESATDKKDKPLKGKELVKTFHEQMDDISKHRLDGLYDQLENEKELKSFLLKRQGGNGRVAELEIDIFKEGSEVDEFTTGQPKTEDHTTHRLVGRFRSSRFHFHTKKSKWDLRIRPSVTACAVERQDGIAKLWFAFEGVLADAATERRPTEKEAAEFIDATNKVAAHALPLLRTAYAASLDAVTKRAKSIVKPVDGHLRVSIADNNGLPFAKLVDAMFFKGATFAEVRQGLSGEVAAKGANEVLTFIQHTSGQTPEDSQIEINTALPGKAAVYCRLHDSIAKANGKGWLVTGLANSAGMISAEVQSSKEWRQVENKPETLRSVSAARPISAVLANQRAKILDRELPPATLAHG